MTQDTHPAQLSSGPVEVTGDEDRAWCERG